MTIKNKFCFLAKSLFLLYLMSFSVSGQSLTTYSDSWMDDETGLAENPENNEVFIVGSAVVEIDPKSNYHSLNTELTLTSPNGRTEFEIGTWTQNSEGTSLTVIDSIPMKLGDETPDTGDYETLVEHFPTCPQSHPMIPGGGSTFPAGVSYAAFEIQLPFNCNSSGCWYNRVSPCNVQCPGGRRMFVFAEPPGSSGACVHLIVPYGPLGCSLITGLRGNVTSCVCFDVVWN